MFALKGQMPGILLGRAIRVPPSIAAKEVSDPHADGAALPINGKNGIAFSHFWKEKGLLILLPCEINEVTGAARKTVRCAKALQDHLCMWERGDPLTEATFLLS
jgi:hypothetical protein